MLEEISRESKVWILAGCLWGLDHQDQGIELKYTQKADAILKCLESLE